ncbi:MAG: HNH endonuclease [Anaerolineales bacterium]
MFIKGKSYSRRDIHARYGGQQQVGISTPANHPMILLFTGQQGQQYGYRDGWTKEGVFLFFGEGRQGNMTFTRGNKALRDHIQDGKDVYLFEYIDTGVVRYVDQMLYIGYELRAARDFDNKLRTGIVFQLVSLEGFKPNLDDYDEITATFDKLSLSELRSCAIKAFEHPTPHLESNRTAIFRSAAVRSYVLRRAAGICEACGGVAPFKTTSGRPYLELHYLRRPSDGGPDHPAWVAGLCPNCHRQAHYGQNRELFNRNLREIILKKEQDLWPSG